MTLLSFLERQKKKQPVGTLALGEQGAFRELFFEKDKVFLCTTEYSGRVDMKSLEESGLLGDELSSSQLESILLSGDLESTLLPELLQDQGMLQDSRRLEQVTAGNIREEILDMLLAATDSFAFQEGRVPESLLDRGGVIARVAIPISELVTSLRERIDKTVKLRMVLPAPDEVFVVTAEGMKHKQTHPNDFALQRVLGLVDGLRDLDTLVRDCQFSEFFTLGLIVDCLDKEILKKTIVPELRGVSTSTLSVEDAASILPLFKNAVKHSVDQLAARERLALVHEKLGLTEECVVQYNFVGDTLYRMKKPAQAIKAYHKALTLKPDEELIVDKITRIYYETAEEKILEGETGEATQLLQNSLRVRPDDWQVFERLVGILAQSGKNKELQDLCDRLTEQAKATGDTMIAVQAYRIVLSKCSNPLFFQRKLVNTYLDFGETKAATALLKEIIGRHLDEDDQEKALKLVETIQQIGEGDDDLVVLRRQLRRDLGITDRKRRASRRRVAVAFVLIAGLLAYQTWNYSAWTTIKSEAVAFAQSEPSPTANEDQSDVRQSDFEAGCLEIARACEAFLGRFPISIFSSNARELHADLQQRARALAARRQEVKSSLLKGADLLLVEDGDRRRVAETLRPLLELEEDHPWRVEAERILSKIDPSARSSHELVQEARALEEQGRPREAYAVYRRLLEQYPSSQLAEGLKLPVLVDSQPRASHVIGYLGLSNEPRFLGKTPFVRHLSPGESFEIELSTVGHYPLRTTLYDAHGQLDPFLLCRKPTWTRQLEDELTIAPVLSDDMLVVACNDGRLQALGLATKQLLGSLARPTLSSITTDPSITEHGIYSVWNDGTIVFLPVDRTSAATRKPVEISLPRMGHGLPTTPVRPLSNGRVVVGSSRKKLLILDALDFAALDPVSLPVEPREISVLDRSKLLVSTRSGTVLAVDIDSKRVLWRRDLGSAFEVPPTVVGTSIVSFTAQRQLHFLDPATGKDRWPAPKLRAQDHLRVDTAGRVIYLLNADNTLATISPESGDVIRQRTLEIQPEALQSAHGSVALLHDEGKSLLILESHDLSPRWATRSNDDPFVEVLARGKSLVARTRKGALHLYPHTPNRPAGNDAGSAAETSK